MAKYRKKPVVIEAIQYDGMVQDVVDFCGMENTEMNKEMTKLYIKTLEGDMLISHGDFVIKGVNGEFYPCKPDIFQKTYEKYNGAALGIKVSVTDTDIFKDLLSVVELAANGATKEETKLRLEAVLNKINR